MHAALRPLAKFGRAAASSLPAARARLLRGRPIAMAASTQPPWSFVGKGSVFFFS
jgi:hypothetical protein